MLSLLDASKYLTLHPQVLLGAVKRPVRPGGVKLPAHTIQGDTYFHIADLDAFNIDLARPWAAEDALKRPEIPALLKGVLRAEAFSVCGLCNAPYAAEFAHIDPWERCRHHHPRNIVYLCTRCHDGHDKEKRISTEELLAAKRNLECRMLELIIGLKPQVPGRCTTFREMCIQINALLKHNEAILFSFGPDSPLAENANSIEAVKLWHSARESTILPNNREIVRILLANNSLYYRDAEFSEMAMRFIAHEESYRQFVKCPNSTHELFRFPLDFADRVATEAEPDAK